MALNVTVATFGSGCNTAIASPSLAQWNQGQILQLAGLTLPASYQVEFTNENTVQAIPRIGTASGVEIPNVLLQSSSPITACIVLHEGQSDRETKYWVRIYIKPRKPPETFDPDPEEVSIIDQTIAAANAAAEAAAGSAETAADEAGKAEAARDAIEDMGVAAEGTAAGTPARVVKTVDQETGAVTLTFYLPAGAAGYSPTVSVSEISGGHRVTVTDAEGPHQFDVMDGRGISSVSLGEDYKLTINFDDGTSWTTPVSIRGATGATPAFTIGTVTTLQPGSQATASIGGTAENPTLSLGIPQGVPGELTAASMAPTFSASTAYSSGDYVIYNGQLYVFTAAHAAGAWIGTDAQAAAIAPEVSDLKNQISDLDGRVDSIEEAEGLHKYGVSGIGQSASALTRLWDSIGMTAQVGTDGDNSNVVNNFDDVTPFNRRKCVGDWTLVDGKPVFHVHAYYGDEDYAEDGTKGDYVAVECQRAYYYFKDGVLGVSAHQWQGWRPFDIFCHEHNPEITLPYVYLPAYALAKKDGKAVSLPGYDNVQGCYKDIMDACRTYDGDGVEAYAHAQPMAVNFYEWALFTVEFATQNCQSIMQGCAGLRNNNDDRATLRSDGKWMLSNYQAGRVVGEYVSIQPTDIDINAVAYYASHKITAITRCDANGNASASGAYQLVETEDLGLGRTYEVGSSYRFAARPYRTGECNGVSTPSGSPVSNSDSYHPMKYRWRENVYSNQYKTIADLFNKKVGTGDDDWALEWYFLPDPSSYTPSTTSKPDATDLATDAFVLLDVETAHANYVNGYIKSKKYSEEFPDIWIPYETTGGSASTYFCDYAYLVHSHVVRACRVGGYWYAGAFAGFSYLSGYAAPSYAFAYYGGDLFFPQ